MTTGTKKGVDGLAEACGVLVVSQHAVLCLADLLRKSLIEMLLAGIEKEKRAKIANELVRFIKSIDFKNPIEEMVSIAGATEGVKKEFAWRMKDWERRLTAYRRIKWTARRFNRICAAYEAAVMAEHIARTNAVISFTLQNPAI